MGDIFPITDIDIGFDRRSGDGILLQGFEPEGGQDLALVVFQRLYLR
jgi:hypothetical protein